MNGAQRTVECAQQLKFVGFGQGGSLQKPLLGAAALVECSSEAAALRGAMRYLRERGCVCL